MKRNWLFSMLLLLTVVVLPRASHAQSRCPVWADASSRFLDEVTLVSCSCPELELLYHEIYARHGRVFEQPELQRHFAAQPWYKPDPGQRGNADLNQFEVWNADLLLRYRRNSGCVLVGPPGVCPIWPAPRLGPLEDRDLAACSCRQLELLRHEIYARHGKVFTEPELKDYFGRQFWYVPDGSNPKGERGQNGFEQRNLGLIAAHEQGRGCKPPVVPAGPPCPTWPTQQMRALAPEELVNCSCRDLEYLRQEIPARHGKVFSEPLHRAWFKAQPWYVPDPNNPTGDRGQNIFERENAIILQNEAKKRNCQPGK